MEQPIPTPEEIEKLKAEHIAYWESQIPYLSKKAEYERLVTELYELELRSVFAQVKMANMQAPPPDEKQPEGEPKMRALRKDPV